MGDNQVKISDRSLLAAIRFCILKLSVLWEGGEEL